MRQEKEKERKRDRRIAWMRLIRDSRLSPAAKLTAFVLATHMDESGLCWQSRTRLAADINRSSRTVARAVNELVSTGHLTIERRWNDSSIYRIAERGEAA